ncbi:hypothetical protein quinque_006256 [Culex quinquefasciatus]
MDYHQLSKLAPLIAAIQDSNVTGVQAALDNGADINFRIAFDENKTALHHAVAAGDPRIVDLLLQNGADPTVKMLPVYQLRPTASAKERPQFVVNCTRPNCWRLYCFVHFIGMTSLRLIWPLTLMTQEHSMTS